MAKRIFGIVLILAGIGIMLFIGLSGCQNTANPGEEVILRIGQSVSIEGEDLLITFAGVSGDSRCPDGAVCIWAGEVTCRVEIEQDGRTSFLDFTYPGLTDSYSELIYKDHVYTYKVQPYPAVDETISDSEYRLYLTVN
jgi:hypothetical protein